MKKLNLLLLLTVGALLFQSCDKAAEEDLYKAKIIGVWKVDNLDIDITVNDSSFSEFMGDDSGVFEALLMNEIEAEFDNISFDFKSDNSYEITRLGDPAETGTWSINSDGSELSINEGTSIEGTYKIKSLTDSYLILNAEESDNSQDINGDGSAEELKIVFDLYLTK
jgi:hypothetical protein